MRATSGFVNYSLWLSIYNLLYDHNCKVPDNPDMKKWKEEIVKLEVMDYLLCITVHMTQLDLAFQAIRSFLPFWSKLLTVSTPTEEKNLVL